jgi:hypothetical protein
MGQFGHVPFHFYLMRQTAETSLRRTLVTKDSYVLQAF